MNRRTVCTSLMPLLSCLLCVYVCVFIFVLVFVSRYHPVPAQAPGFPIEGMECRVQNPVP